MDWTDFWDERSDATQWLVEPFLASGRSHALYAPSKSGKSLLSLEVAAALATGRRVLDCPEGAPRRVLYIDAEMTEDDLRERLTEMRYAKSDDLSGLVYYLLPNLEPLDTPTGAGQLLALADKHDVDLVVIDTVGRTVEGEENSADTMRNFARLVGGPLKTAGRTVLRVDHAGKDLGKGQRGSSAKNDDVDVVWELTAKNDCVTLKATHHRINWVPAQIDVLRQEDPLRHVLVEPPLPKGTDECIQALEDLGVPLDFGRPKAAEILRGAGRRVSTEALAAALRQRRKAGRGDRTAQTGAEGTGQPDSKDSGSA